MRGSGKLFTKLAKEIIVVAREGGGDPDANFRLRMAIQRAKGRQHARRHHRKGRQPRRWRGR